MQSSEKYIENQEDKNVIACQKQIQLRLDFIMKALSTLHQSAYQLKCIMNDEMKKQKEPYSQEIGQAFQAIRTLERTIAIYQRMRCDVDRDRYMLAEWGSFPLKTPYSLWPRSPIQALGSDNEIVPSTPRSSGKNKI